MPFEATRYHSLIVERESFPRDLKVTAETADGLVMGLRHRRLEVEGVQFHPESILTTVGPRLLENFLTRCASSAETPEKTPAAATVTPAGSDLPAGD